MKTKAAMDKAFKQISKVLTNPAKEPILEETAAHIKAQFTRKTKFILQTNYQLTPFAEKS